MPFESKAQRRACYAAKDPNWDCAEWEEATGGKKLPERKKSKATKVAGDGVTTDAIEQANADLSLLKQQGGELSDEDLGALGDIHGLNFHQPDDWSSFLPGRFAGGALGLLGGFLAHQQMDPAKGLAGRFRMRALTMGGGLGGAGLGEAAQKWLRKRRRQSAAERLKQRLVSLKQASVYTAPVAPVEKKKKKQKSFLPNAALGALAVGGLGLGALGATKAILNDSELKALDDFVDASDSWQTGEKTLGQMGREYIHHGAEAAAVRPFGASVPAVMEQVRRLTDYLPSDLASRISPGIREHYEAFAAGPEAARQRRINELVDIPYFVGQANKDVGFPADKRLPRESEPDNWHQDALIGAATPEAGVGYSRVIRPVSKVTKIINASAPYLLAAGGLGLVGLLANIIRNNRDDEDKEEA